MIQKYTEIQWGYITFIILHGQSKEKKHCHCYLSFDYYDYFKNIRIFLKWWYVKYYAMLQRRKWLQSYIETIFPLKEF